MSVYDGIRTTAAARRRPRRHGQAAREGGRAAPAGALSAAPRDGARRGHLVRTARRRRLRCDRRGSHAGHAGRRASRPDRRRAAAGRWRGAAGARDAHDVVAGGADGVARPSAARARPRQLPPRLQPLPRPAPPRRAAARQQFLLRDARQPRDRGRGGAGPGHRRLRARRPARAAAARHVVDRRPAGDGRGRRPGRVPRPWLLRLLPRIHADIRPFVAAGRPADGPRQRRSSWTP